MELLDKYNELREQVFAYFGYVEDWRAIPLDDSRMYFWKLRGEGPGDVLYADSEEELESEDGNFYSDEIYTQRHLPKWVYRGADYTMVCCNPHTYGNTFLRIFSNENERTD